MPIIKINDTDQSSWQCPGCKFTGYPGVSQVIHAPGTIINDHIYTCKHSGHSIFWSILSRRYHPGLLLKVYPLSSISAPSLVRLFLHLEKKMLWFEEFGSKKQQKVAMRRFQIGRQINAINDELQRRK